MVHGSLSVPFSVQTGSCATGYGGIWADVGGTIIMLLVRPLASFIIGPFPTELLQDACLRICSWAFDSNCKGLGCSFTGANKTKQHDYPAIQAMGGSEHVS